jgi:hypothetical protein
MYAKFNLKTISKTAAAKVAVLIQAEINLLLENMASKLCAGASVTGVQSTVTSSQSQIAQLEKCLAFIAAK